MLFKNLCLSAIFSMAVCSSCHSQITTNVDVVNFEQAIAKGNMQLLEGEITIHHPGRPSARRRQKAGA